MKNSKRKQKSAPAKQTPELDVAVPPAQSETAIPPSLPVDVAVDAAEPSFALSASCTMREVALLKGELMKFLSVRKTVLLDVSAVERIDTSAMQLLCAFVRDRRARRVSTRWVGRTQAFSEAVEILGLTSALGYQPK